MSKKIILLIIVLIAVLAVLLLLALSKQKQTPGQTVVYPTPIQVQPQPTNEVSKISILVPGKSSEEDVIKILGQPSSQSQTGPLTQLDYPSSLNNFNETVALKQNIVYYTIENVFSDSTYGTTQGFISKFGNSFVVLYNTSGDYYWDMYLSGGFGIETNGEQILKMIRFTPQNEAGFLAVIGANIGVSQNKIVPHEGL